MKALIVIDYTVDFVTGNLPCGEPAIAIENRICQLTKQFVEQGNEVIMAVDLHEQNDSFHPESKLFPPHNIRGTAGRDLYGALQLTYTTYSDHIHWMDKTRYSSFAGTDLDLRLRARGINELHLIGVCTDICVLHTAIDAYNLGYQINVHEDGVASFNGAGHEWALTHFKGTLGATILNNGEQVQ